MKSLALLLLLICVPPNCSTLVHAQESVSASQGSGQVGSGWQQLTPASGQFTIQFPVKPQHTIEEIDGAMKFETYAYDPQNKGANDFSCGVGFMNLTPQLMSKMGTSYIETIKKEILGSKTSLSKESDIHLGPCGGKEISGIDKKEGEFRLRVFTTVDSIYFTFFVSQSAEQMRNKGVAFLNSFRLIKSNCVPSGVPENSPQTWKEFSPTGRGFSVLMPGTPEEDRPKEGTPEASSKGYIATLNTGWAIYVVSYRDTAHALDNPEQIKMILDLARNVSVENGKGKLLSESDVMLGTNLGREYTLELQGMTLRSRMFLIGKRFYHVTFSAPLLNDSSDTDVQFYDHAATRFLNSFTLK